MNRITTRRVTPILTALCLSLAVGVLPLQLACGGKDQDKTSNAAPTISSFLASSDGRFVVTDTAHTGTSIDATSGATIYLKAAFGTTGGSAVVMPGNLTLNPNTAIPVVVTGTTTYTLTVTNASGAKTTALVTVTVKSSPVIQSYSNEDATYYVGVKIADNTVTATGATPITYSVPSGSPALPAGLSLNPSSGAITGTPTLTSAQTTYTVQATNSVGSTTHNIRIAVAATPISFSVSPSSITQGAGATLTWDATSVAGLFSSVTITANPADASLPASFGLSGTANVSPLVTTTYTLSATPSLAGAAAVTKAADLTVGAAPVHFTSFNATPAAVPLGSTSTLSWTYTGTALDLTLDSVNVLGSFDKVVTPYGRQTYTLYGSNFNGNETATVKVGARALYNLAGSYGSGRGTLDGDPDANGISTARFYRTQVMTRSGYSADNGALFVVDYSANTIRRIGSDRKVRTIAGMAGIAGVNTTNTDTSTLLTPRALAVDPVTGDVYVGGEGYTNKRLLKLTRNGDGTYTPTVVANFTYNANGLYIDSNRVLYAGTYDTSKVYTMDLTAATPAPTEVADFSSVMAVAKMTCMAADFNGGRKRLYIGGSTYKVVMVDLSTATPTSVAYAGVGTTGFADNATATSGAMTAPQSLAVDTKGNLYISDRDNATVRMVPFGGTYAGQMITVVGKAVTKTPGYLNAVQTLDGALPTAANTSATIAYPYGIALSADDSKLYVADAESGVFNTQAVRCVTIANMDANGFPQSGTTFTVEDPNNQNYAFAGGPRIYGYADGVGAAAQFRLTSSGTSSLTTGANVAVLPDGSKTFVADTGNNLVRIITANGTVTTLANASGSIAFLAPKGIAVQVDGTGALTALFVADTGTTKKIRRFTPDAGASTFTEDTAFVLSGTSGTNYPASLNVQGMAVDGTNLYFTDFSANNVYLVDLANSNASSVLVTGGSGTPAGIAIQPGSTKYLWVAFAGNNQVAQYAMTGGTAIATIGATTAGFTDSPATFNRPVGVIADANGFVYVTDNGNNAIRAIDTNNGNTVTTLLGTATSTTAANYYGQRMGLLNSDRTSGDATNLIGGYVFAPQGMGINATGDLFLTSGNTVYTLVAPANK